LIRLSLDDDGGPAGGSKMESRKAHIVLGRDVTADIRIPERFTRVSRHHADIRFVENWYHLANVSQNGTWLNDEPIDTMVVKLRENDVIQLGEAGPRLVVEFVFDRARWLRLQPAEPAGSLLPAFWAALVLVFLLNTVAVCAGLSYWGFAVGG
jgi:predicted component of type VI protein secretion system